MAHTTNKNRPKQHYISFIKYKTGIKNRAYEAIECVCRIRGDVKDLLDMYRRGDAAEEGAPGMLQTPTLALSWHATDPNTGTVLACY